jgi:crotonobetainyl-CoA:carnitine CoA-transferase CaiB-like acyl-CoA transferase
MLPEEILRCSLGAPDPVPRANRGAAGFEWATPCAGDDNWLAVSVLTPVHREAAAGVAGHPELADGSDSDLARVVEQWSRGLSKQAAMSALQAAGVPAAAVMKGPELLSDDYFSSIDFFKHVPLPGSGEERQRGWIVRFDGEPGGQIKSRAPHVGEHTTEILRSLGYDQRRIDQLLEAQVIAQAGQQPGLRPLPGVNQLID